MNVTYEAAQAHDGDSWRVMRCESTDPSSTVRTEVARYKEASIARGVARAMTMFATFEVSQW